MQASASVGGFFTSVDRARVEIELAIQCAQIFPFCEVDCSQMRLKSFDRYFLVIKYAKRAFAHLLLRDIKVMRDDGFKLAVASSQDIIARKFVLVVEIGRYVHNPALEQFELLRGHHVLLSDLVQPAKGWVGMSLTRFKNLTGQKFGRLTALRPVGKDAGRNVLWLCHCDCGKEMVTRGFALGMGRTTSCGCSHN